MIISGYNWPPWSDQEEGTDPGVGPIVKPEEPEAKYACPYMCIRAGYGQEVSLCGRYVKNEAVYEDRAYALTRVGDKHLTTCRRCAEKASKPQ